MRILLTGANGQVGWELARTLPAVGDVLALDRKQCDLTDLSQVRTVVRETKPDVLVNAAAYTAVDQAEREPEAAWAVNAIAPGIFAEELERTSGLLVHYSTDYVFDGTKPGPYIEQDRTCPINAYGDSKLAGEQAIQDSGTPHLIFRTSWVYGARGKNFLLTMLRLFDERPELRIVSDQIGAPTWSRWIAKQTVNAIRLHRARAEGEPSLGGIFHMTAGGVTSWYGFASAIQRLYRAPRAGAVPHLLPVSTAEYPTAAKRPLNSVLSNEKLTELGLLQAPWETLLAECVADLQAGKTHE